MNHSFNELEKTLGYHFRNKNLLHEAMSHPSLKQHNKIIQNYERLELLGDAVLNFIITEMLFVNFKNETEGNLAKLRAYLISGEVLCNVAYDLDLAKYIIMTQGEENSNGRDNKGNLENAAESLIAAIYLDSDISQIKKIINKLWVKYLNNISDIKEYDSKTALQEFVQSNKWDIPLYEVIEKSGNAHEPVFTVRVSAMEKFEIAKGKSIKIAQKEAAKKLLRELIR